VNVHGVVIWLTGRPAGGKTTLARALMPLLEQRGYRPVLIDSDHFRDILTPDPTYSAAERDWFYAVLGQLAAWLAKHDLCAIVAATAHLRAYRAQARAIAPRFMEVFVHCPLAVAQARDPKGIYALAAAGKAETVPGIGVPYEPPTTPEATVDTGRLSPTQAARSVMQQLKLEEFDV
jgi:adenylylsulfate kinase